uniref:Uncharacterized protein n=1 Tax=Zooxanthella nutricula TaxID=1333877 RepID=A0A7S2QKG5_9DINO
MASGSAPRAARIALACFVAAAEGAVLRDEFPDGRCCVCKNSIRRALGYYFSKSGQCNQCTGLDIATVPFFNCPEFFANDCHVLCEGEISKQAQSDVVVQAMEVIIEPKTIKVEWSDKALLDEGASASLSIRESNGHVQQRPLHDSDPLCGTDGLNRPGDRRLPGPDGTQIMELRETTPEMTSSLDELGAVVGNVCRLAKTLSSDSDPNQLIRKNKFNIDQQVNPGPRCCVCQHRGIKFAGGAHPGVYYSRSGRCTRCLREYPVEPLPPLMTVPWSEPSTCWGSLRRALPFLRHLAFSDKKRHQKCFSLVKESVGQVNMKGTIVQQVIRKWRGDLRVTAENVFDRNMRVFFGESEVDCAHNACVTNERWHEKIYGLAPDETYIGGRRFVDLDPSVCTELDRLCFWQQEVSGARRSYDTKNVIEVLRRRRKQ